MRPVVVVTAVLSLAACSKTAQVDLKLVEACDQKNQALNGISSFRVSTTGAENAADNALVTFTKDQGPSPLSIGLGNVVVTVQAFTDAGAAQQAGALPQSLGRTMPIDVAAGTTDQNSMVLVGKLDSFGTTTSKAGACTAMTAGAPKTGRHGHTATFVPVLNKVLIFGGAVFDADGNESFLDTSELYDPNDGSFTELPVTEARAYHAATALPDGRVLITGGLGIISGQVSALVTAEIFDPALGNDPFHAFNLKQPRAHHTSTLMAGDNLVAIVGGCTGLSAADGCTTTGAGAGNRGPSTALTPTSTFIETFDVTQATAAAATVAVANLPDGTPILTQRAFHQATSLENGANTILVVTGGANADGPVLPIELYRVTSGVLTKVSESFSFPAGKAPARHAAIALDAHRILLIGGQTAAPQGVPSGPGSSDLIFFQDVDGVHTGDADVLHLFNNSGRAGHVASKLNDGSILVIGGATADGAPTAEVLRTGVGTAPFTAQVLTGPPLGEAREDGAMAELPTNQVFFSGGFNKLKQTSAAAQIYFGP